MNLGTLENQTLGRSGGSHSANIQIQLRTGDTTFTVSQIGGGHLIFPHPVIIPSHTGEVTLTIDGLELKWSVELLTQSQPSPMVEIAYRNMLQVTERSEPQRVL